MMRGFDMHVYLKEDDVTVETNDKTMDENWCSGITVTVCVNKIVLTLHEAKQLNRLLTTFLNID
jgi:hypothetical protein